MVLRWTLGTIQDGLPGWLQLPVQCDTATVSSYGYQLQFQEWFQGWFFVGVHSIWRGSVRWTQQWVLGRFERRRENRKVCVIWALDQWKEIQ